MLRNKSTIRNFRRFSSPTIPGTSSNSFSFTNLPKHLSSRDLPNRNCPFHGNLHKYISQYKPNFPDKFPTSDTRQSDSTSIKFENGKILELNNFDKLTIVTASRYSINVVHYRRISAAAASADPNDQINFKIWKVDEDKTKVFLPLMTMNSYLKKGVKHRKKNFMNDFVDYLASVSPEDNLNQSNHAILFQFYGEGYYKKLTFEEYKILEREKYQLKQAGEDAFTYKTRKVEEVLMVEGAPYITRGANRLMNTKYTSGVNRLYDVENRYSLTPSELVSQKAVDSIRESKIKKIKTDQKENMVFYQKMVQSLKDAIGDTNNIELFTTPTPDTKF